MRMIKSLKYTCIFNIINLYFSYILVSELLFEWSVHPMLKNRNGTIIFTIFLTRSLFVVIHFLSTQMNIL